MYDGITSTVNVVSAGDDCAVNQKYMVVRGGIQILEPCVTARLVFPDNREFTAVNIFAGSLEEAKKKVHIGSDTNTPDIKREDFFRSFCFASEVYVKTLPITQAQLALVDALLMSENGSTDRKIAHTATFPDEIEMQTICYNGADGAYAYGVLYDHGEPWTITEEYSQYTGLWEMSKGGTLYIANVVVE